ncbi:hypothetical protein [Schnuerera sp.]|uniref:hypothetical protein n=1 Tax=Schnuerera sp. TaxID=2794844 RepID=UPI002C738887|nr:hypothetical protein [Schnuerera sp.]HSH35063.1 hypothetical protein [Schnuerera sp.]
MWKKLTISLVAIIMFFSISTVGFAAPTDNKVDITKYQVITPEESSSATNNKVILISGKAPEGTDIIIDLYGAIDLTGGKYSLTNLPKEDDYSHISSINIKSGDIGFGEEVELILGINKIIITFDVEGVPTVEKIRYYYEKEQVEKSLTNSPISPSAK